MISRIGLNIGKALGRATSNITARVRQGVHYVDRNMARGGFFPKYLGDAGLPAEIEVPILGILPFWALVFGGMFELGRRHSQGDTLPVKEAISTVAESGLASILLLNTKGIFAPLAALGTFYDAGQSPHKILSAVQTALLFGLQSLGVYVGKGISHYQELRHAESTLIRIAEVLGLKEHLPKEVGEKGIQEILELAKKTSLDPTLKNQLEALLEKCKEYAKFAKRDFSQLLPLDYLEESKSLKQAILEAEKAVLENLKPDSLKGILPESFMNLQHLASKIRTFRGFGFIRELNCVFVPIILVGGVGFPLVKYLQSKFAPHTPAVQQTKPSLSQASIWLNRMRERFDPEAENTGIFGLGDGPAMIGSHNAFTSASSGHH